MKKTYISTTNNTMELKVYHKLFSVFILTLIMFFGSVSISAQVEKQLYLKSSTGLNRVVPTSTTVSSTASLYKSSAVITSSGRFRTGNTGTSVGTTNSTTANTTNSPTYTATGTDRLMMVTIVSIPDATDSNAMTSVTFGTQTFTKLSQQINGIVSKVEIWYLLSPTANVAQLVTVNWATGTTFEGVVGVTVLNNVNQLNPFGTVATGSSTSTSLATISPATAVGDLVIDAVATVAGNAAATTGQTEVFNASTNKILGASSYKTGAAGNTTLSWTLSQGGSQAWSNIGVAIKGQSFNSVTFTQSPVLCSPFTIKAGQTITILTHAAVTSGTAAAGTLPVVLQLKNGATTIFKSASAVNSGLGANGSTGTLTWTGTIASDITIPVGGALSLELYSDYSDAQIRIDYDAVSKPSQIKLPTTTYINVTNHNVYNAAYNGGTTITSNSVGVTNYLRTVVTDPFGFNDITGLTYMIGTAGPFTATSVATSGCTRTYEYAWTPTTTGTYNIVATAKEGTEGTVTHSSSTSFTVTKPSISVTKTKTSPAIGPYKINDNIVYNIAIQNTGTTALTYLPLSDTFDKSCLQYVSSTVTPANISGGVISWGHLGNLAAATTVNITVTMKVIGNCDPANNTARVEGAKDANNAVADTKESTIGINIDVAPVAVADTYCVQGSTALTVLGNDTDGDLTGFLSATANAALYNITFPTPPSKGTVTVNGDKTIQFNPLGGTPMIENDVVTFRYQVAEIAFPSLFSEAIVTVRYSVINSAPTAMPDVATTSTDLPVVINVLANDSDPDGAMTVTAITAAPSNGSAVINANGTITYTPYSGFKGSDVFTYRVCDDGCPTPSLCATATVTVNVDFAYYVCKDGSSTISVSAVPGATGYTWTLPAGASPASGATTVSPSISVNWSGVNMGTYDVCVAPTNYCGPGTQQCVKVVVNKPTLSFVPTQIACFGQNTGAIDLTVSGGIAPYTYVWTRTSGGFSASIEDPNNLSPGTYNVTITDKYGCTATGSATITQPATAVVVSGVVSDATNPSSNGSITLTVSNGTPSYTYLWSNGATTKDITGLAGGTYNVTVTDANGCSLVKYFTVNTVGGPLTISSLLATPVNCFGGSTGTIDLEVTGGTGTYTYVWTRTSGGFSATTQDLINLSEGTYNVTISSPGYTNAVGSVTVTQPAAALTATSTFTNVTCNGLSNGTVTVSVSGGTAPYTYLWNTGATTQNLTNIGPGTYSVTVTGANGCTATTSKTISQPTVMVLSGVVGNVSCLPIVSGSIILTPTGGTPIYTYLWSNGATSKDITGLSTGVYSVTVTDAAGCKTGKTFEVLNVCLEVTKSVLTAPINNNNGTYTLSYQVKIKNTGTTNLLNVQAIDNLATTFTSPATFSTVSISSTKFTVNGSYNGSSNTNLLAASQSLTPGEEGLINISLTVTPGTFANPYSNTTTATGYDSNGLPTSKSSSVPVTFTETPIIGIAKELSSIPMINADGSYNLEFTLRVRNFGNVPLKNVQVTDNLLTTFGALATINVLSISSTDLAVNSAYNGTTALQLLTGTDVLAVNEIKTIKLNLKVTPAGAGPFNNIANATATGPGGTTTTDASQNGILPDPDFDGNPANNNVPTPITFPEHPSIGLAKRVVGVPVNNNNGTYTFTYEFTVKNTGDVVLKNVQLTDNLTTTFGGNTVVKNALTSSYFSVNSSYNGTSDLNLLTGTNNLAVGGQYTVLLTVTVTPSNLGPYQNTATASGSSPFNTAVNDISHNGTDVDPENDGPQNNSTPTPVSFTETPKMGLAKSVSTPINNNNGTYTVAYTIYVKNMGDVPLTNVQVADNLATTFTGAITYSVTGITASSGLTANTIAGFNSTNNLLVAASSTVAYSTTATITLNVLVTPGTKLGVYDNSASGTATGSAGTAVSDVSYNGTNPDPDGDGDPTNNALVTPVSFTESPAIAVTKAIFSGPTQSGSNYVLTYRITVANTGDVPLTNVQVAEDLLAAFTSPASVVSATASSATFTVSSTFNGKTDVNLLASAQSLAYGASKTIDVTVTVNPNGLGGPYTNTAFGLAESPTGQFILNSGNVDVTFFENPSIGLAKKLMSVTDNGNGTNTVTLLLTIENFGDVSLKNLELYDNIVTQFTSVSPTGFFASNGTLFGNGTWNGTATSNILDAGQSIGVGQSGTIEISFIVAPGAVCSIDNSASAKGFSPSGTKSSTDISTDGLDPDGINNDNNPNEQVATPVKVTLAPTPAVTNMTTTTCSAVGFTVTPVDSTNGLVPAGTTYSWSAPTVTGGMTGGTSGTAQSSITGALTNATAVVQTATYTVTPTSGSCSGATFTVTVTVNPLPTLTIVNPAAVCSPATVDITTAAVQTSNTGITTKYYTSEALANAGGTSDVATPSALGSGTYYIRSESAAGCFIVKSVTVTVNPLPADITGLTSVYVNSTITLNSTTAGGSWSSGSPAIATISATGVVTGKEVGTSLISYTLATGCFKTFSITVSALIQPVTESVTVSSSTGGVLTNIASNDKVNGVQATLGTAGNATVAVSGTWPTGITLDASTGDISIAIGTVPGVYSVTYQLCDKLSSPTCATMVDVITVSTSPIVAVNDTTFATQTSSTTGPKTIGNVTTNDTLNGVLVTAANTDVTPITTGPLSIDSEGVLTLAASTPPGTYTITYQLCEVGIVPANCDSAIATVKVENREIIAIADILAPINGSIGGTTTSVLVNDTVNGLPVSTTNVTLTATAVPTGLTLNSNGTITIAPGTAGGIYVVTYQICELVNTTNCSSTTATVFVESPAIKLIKTAVFNDQNGDGYGQVGETITYSFRVVNAGNVVLRDVSITDDLPGLVLTGSPIAILEIGAFNDTAYTATYALTQADVNLSKVTNQATVAGTSPNGVIVQNMSTYTIVEDEKPTILNLKACVIEVFNGMSPNGDGYNDIFRIAGLECYPDNTVEIYNRWGVLVFERDHYNNDDRAFKGISEGRVTVRQSEGLPDGTYYYIFNYKDSDLKVYQKAGYLYINRK